MDLAQVNSWEQRSSSRAAPEPDNFDAFLIGSNTVDDAIGTHDDFANSRILDLRHFSPDLGKLTEVFRA